MLSGYKSVRVWKCPCPLCSLGKAKEDFRFSLIRCAGRETAITLIDPYRIRQLSSKLHLDFNSRFTPLKSRRTPCGCFASGNRKTCSQGLRFSRARLPDVLTRTSSQCSAVRVGRIELPSSDWQPDVLPLNHTRLARHHTTPSIFISSAGHFLTSFISAPTKNRTWTYSSEDCCDIHFTIGAYE